MQDRRDEPPSHSSGSFAQLMRETREPETRWRYPRKGLGDRLKKTALYAEDPMSCPSCAAEPSSAETRFCTKCGAALKSIAAVAPGGRRWVLGMLPFVFLARALAYPFKQKRRRWLAEASGPDSPIDYVGGLSDDARRVYRYLADVTLRVGSSHSRIRTIAHAAGVSERKAREAIRELERRGFLSHRRRDTWHGRGAHSYDVKRIDTSRRD
jgi:helix-turn-helix protein